MSELATILEHETMDFSSASGTPVDCERRASEPDMSHRGILDCIDSIEPTDSDSQHSSSESSRGISESLHSLSRLVQTIAKTFYEMRFLIRFIFTGRNFYSTSESLKKRKGVSEEP